MKPSSIPALLLFTIPVFSQSNSPCTSGIITAPSIAVNTTCIFQAGTTVGATVQTNSQNGGTPSCGSMGPDVWYSFTAPANGLIEISTKAGTITDGVMALYSGTCGSFTQLACNDDDATTMPFISISALSPGVTHLIRFWNYGGGTGTFSICVMNIPTPLPLHLLSFSGHSAGTEHLIAWQTADELNTSYFDVERSADGISFSLLTRIPASGTGNHSYSARDRQPLEGRNYYRLRSTDQDGKFTYSNIIVLKNAGQGSPLLSVYPNPSANQLQVIAPIANAGQAGRIILYNMAGQALLQVPASGASTLIDIRKLAAGTYILQWSAGDAVIMRTKFVKAENAR